MYWSAGLTPGQSCLIAIQASLPVHSACNDIADDEGVWSRKVHGCTSPWLLRTLHCSHPCWTSTTRLAKIVQYHLRQLGYFRTEAPTWHAAPAPALDRPAMQLEIPRLPRTALHRQKITGKTSHRWSSVPTTGTELRCREAYPPICTSRYNQTWADQIKVYGL